MAKIEGACLCGEVRYKCEAEPLMQVMCHCTTCQKNSSSAFSLNIAVPLDSVVAKGDAMRTYIDNNGASGLPFNRNYCSSCGSHVYSHGPAYGSVAFIKAGTLDDPSWVKPTMHIWTSEKLPWVTIPDGDSQYPGNPD